MYQSLIFDLDGLLIDSETIYRKISYKMAADLGKQLHDGIWVKQMGRSPIESLGIFRKELGITTHTAQELVDLRNILLTESYRNDLQIIAGCDGDHSRFSRKHADGYCNRIAAETYGVGH